MDKSSEIFGNKIDKKTLKKAENQQKKFLKKFGDDRNTIYHLKIIDNEVLTPAFGVKILTLAKNNEKNLSNGQQLPQKSIIVGNIRMGFGHYRISMAMASAAASMGYTPLWFDLNSFPETTGTKIISYLNDLYSMGSRWSQKYSLFNKLFWEPLNSEGFRKLTYNACDQKTTELMTPIFHDIPKDTPYVATHAWPSQAAIHAGMSNVVNAIPDNWPMALHLSEGALHAVQTPSSYLGYRTLRGMRGTEQLHPMSKNDITYTGHYIDHEMVQNIEIDCKKRIERSQGKGPIRFLLTVGGAGAQGDYFAAIINTLLPSIKSGKACLYINVGDHKAVIDIFNKKCAGFANLTQNHFDNWNETLSFCETALNTDKTAKPSKGIHIFYHKDIFAAVYSTNLLIRASDVLVTKPSELAFYPIPKLMIKHVGGHEVWGAIRAEEVGDGTFECEALESATGMIKQIIVSPDIIATMCNFIVAANKISIYNGAYNIIKVATQGGHD
ncbi:MAG: hypothetical protein BKP49_08890 [Treponema sp. CETP13]|nr:MAG: hypothetical protein BKP49_08890 [Treponema sp. CETP13]